MRPDTAFFDMSTNSVAVVRKINAAFAEKNLYMLNSPVSGGPGGAASGKMAIWVGGDEQIFNRHKPVLDAMGDQAAYIGPIGAGSIAKLVHNCTSAVMGVALAEVFTMGIKAGVEPLDLWEAVRQGATGRQRDFRPARPVSGGQARPGGFCAASVAQGCRACGWSRSRGRRADAPRQHGLRGIDRSDEPRLGHAQQHRRPAIAGRARRHRAARRRSRAGRRRSSTPTSRSKPRSKSLPCRRNRRLGATTASRPRTARLVGASRLPGRIYSPMTYDPVVPDRRKWESDDGECRDLSARRLPLHQACVPIFRRGRRRNLRMVHLKDIMLDRLATILLWVWAAGVSRRPEAG